jgi:Flp pilus assembly protein TadB
MATQPKLDSDNRAVRFIERWKRGATAGFIAALMLIVPSLAAGAAAAVLAEWLGASPWYQTLAGAVGLIVAGPWTFGSRQTLRIIGDLAKVGDN